MTLHLISTGTDGTFDLSAYDWRQVNILDVAWSLAQTNRFMGHAVRPYSVAEHSLLVAEIAERQFGLDAHGVQAALLHDAHEAYCGDLHPYTKRVLGMAWRNHERELERAVRGAFWLHTAAAVNAEWVKQADLVALATELRDVVGGASEDWGERAGVPAAGWLRLDTPERAARDWEYWRDAFVDRYHELEAARAAALHAATDAAPRRAPHGATADGPRDGQVQP